MSTEPTRPPSVDALARSLAKEVSLPHALLVDCARRAIQSHPTDAENAAHQYAHELHRSLLVDVVNATGVLLHTNLGRAPLRASETSRANNVEFNMSTGERGSRHDAVSRLVSTLTGAEAAIVVNNNAAAVMLVLAALAQGRDVAVSRGESVEIGGNFRIPDVMEQSGARLVDVGTTNRTRLSDYTKAIASSRNDIALLMKIHPSNFSIEGFTEGTSVRELATTDVPVVVDIGSGLLDNTCPWLQGHMPQVPQWLANEPAALQALTDGAALVTFSGDKLLGGPQCGIIAGRKDLVAICAAHPLMRALRPGSHTMQMLQSTLLSYCARTVCEDIPFWFMLTQTTASLRARAESIVQRAVRGDVVALDALVGAGSAPGTTVESCGIALTGDHRETLRGRALPVITRAVNGTTFIDLRSVHPDDDAIIVDALQHLA